MAIKGSAYVGIDLGGTKTRIGLVSQSSPDVIVRDCTLATQKENPFDATGQMAECMKKLLDEEGMALLAIGIGAPGPLEREKGTLLDLPNLPSWRGFPIRIALQNELGVPVVLENDANAAALGEFKFGAGRGIEDFLYVTLGTGIGGALILNGQLYEGAFGGAGEIGHIQVDPLGPVCGCGQRGCVETLASGPAIQRMFGQPTEKVFDLAAQGDERALEVLSKSGKALGIAFRYAVTLLDPKAIILGGGMISGNEKALSSYIEACRKEIELKAFFTGKDRLEILKSSLGNDAGVLGAAWLAREAHSVGVTGTLPKITEKPWGKETLWALTPHYAGKVISVRAGHSLSLQYHREKDETMYFVTGRGFLQLGDQKHQVLPGSSFNIPKGQIHRVIAETDLEFLEVSTPQLDDVVRLKDDYGRVKTGES